MHCILWSDHMTNEPNVRGVASCSTNIACVTGHCRIGRIGKYNNANMYLWANVTVKCRVHKTYVDCSTPYVNEFKCSGFVSTLNWSAGMSIWVTEFMEIRTWVDNPSYCTTAMNICKYLWNNDNMEIVNASIRQFIIHTNTNCNLLGPAPALCAQLSNVWRHTQMSQISGHKQSEMATTGGENHPRWCRK